MADEPEFPPLPDEHDIKAAENRIKASGILQRIVNRNQQISIRPDNVYDNVNAFRDKFPFFYDKNNIFWIWDEEEYRYVMTDEVALIVFLESCFQMYGQSLNAKLRGEYLWAFKIVGRRFQPIDPPKTWIQFGDTVFDYETKRSRPAEPDYFMCNPIPWKIGETDKTPIMDQLITDWVGAEYVQTIYELIAYCCVTNYPLHTIFCFIGVGRNGKSSLQQLLKVFIGEHNICSTDLDQLVESRFESAKLYKKTLCLMGETDFGIMQHTGRLKRLTGQDLIGYEFKGKQPFDGENYAKLVISTNSLPSSNDTSDGFYRRWLIIDFPNEFAEGAEIVAKIPESEYSALANKVVGIIPTLLAVGKFTNQGSIEERKTKYLMASNPLPLFIEANCDVGIPKGYIPIGEFVSRFQQYLTKNKRRMMKNKEIELDLSLEGVYKDNIMRINENGEKFHGWAYMNISWKPISQKSQISHYSDSQAHVREQRCDHSDNCDNCDKICREFVMAFWHNPDNLTGEVEWLKIAQNLPDKQFDRFISIVADLVKEGAIFEVPGTDGRIYKKKV